MHRQVARRRIPLRLLPILCLFMLLPTAPAAAPPDKHADWRSLGQKIYVPAYSRIHLRNGNAVPLAANLAVHNTDPDNPISIVAVAYYDSAGKLVEQLVSEARTLAPLATASYFVKSDDLRGGDGANFLVSWRSVSAVNQPVVEAVMVGTFGTRAFSFVSPGRVVTQP